MGASVWTIVVAGGSGTRYGRPKQFDRLGARPVVEWSVATARAATDAVVLVLPAAHAAAAAQDPAARFGADVVVAGGDSRSASVRQGLAAVPADVEVIVVHDAARPLASRALFDAVVAPLLAPSSPWAGVVCALPVSDTLKRLAEDGTTVAATVERTGLVAVQTPQAFRAPALRRAHDTGGDASDDAALVEAAGGAVAVVPGEAGNLKLTTPGDLAFLRHRAEGDR